jgi:hypothetical protein
MTGRLPANDRAVDEELPLAVVERVRVHHIPAALHHHSQAPTMIQIIQRTPRCFKLVLMLFCSLPAGMVLAQASIDADTVSLHETDATISIVRAGIPLIVYNKQPPPLPEGIEPIYRRSGFLHPVNTPSGKTVTATYPVDHAHQHGIFTAWVNTSYNGQPVDFWNLAGGTGRVAHQRVAEISSNAEQIEFTVQLVHQAILNSAATTPAESAEPEGSSRTQEAGALSDAEEERKRVVDVLQETWKIRLVVASAEYSCFDLEIEQKALTDMPLIVHEYHYGGLAARGPVEWLLPEGNRNGAESQHSPSYMLNNLGSDRIQGNHEHATWVALTGTIDAGYASIAVLSHGDNFRAPQAARLHPTKPYFCFAPCVDGQFTIDKEHPYSGQFRFYVFDGQPNAQWLDEQWRQWQAED